MSALLASAVFASGGGLGAVARHWSGRLIDHRFPFATLLVNVLGSLVLGAALASVEVPGSFGGEGAERLVLGFCGGFTTFSSFAVQTLELRRDHSVVHAVANVMVNLGSCLAAFWLGGVVVRG